MIITPAPGDLKDGPVLAEDLMAIGHAEVFAFGHKGTSFRKGLQGADLLFQAQDEGSG